MVEFDWGVLENCCIIFGVVKFTRGLFNLIGDCWESMNPNGDRVIEDGLFNSIRGLLEIVELDVGSSNLSTDRSV